MRLEARVEVLVGGGGVTLTGPWGATRRQPRAEDASEHLGTRFVRGQSLPRGAGTWIMRLDQILRSWHVQEAQGVGGGRASCQVLSLSPLQTSTHMRPRPTMCTPLWLEVLK